MKQIKTCSGLVDQALLINALDEVGPGGANHLYSIKKKQEDSPLEELKVKFQEGPVSSSKDINGITNESLLLIVVNRMEGFQSGPYACEENEEVLGDLRKALASLEKRTQDRKNRGVEGKLEE